MGINKTIKKAFIFIDGSNLYHNFKASFIKPSEIDLSKMAQLIAKNFNCELKKVIYFNSIPSLEDGKEKYYAHMSFLEDLKKRGFEVKTRKLQRLSNQERIQIINNEISSLGLCKTCEPIVKSHWKDYMGAISVKEKGIDIMISTDMMMHGLIRKDCNACILVSGDADFIPCMELIKSSGVWVASSSTVKGYSYELRAKFPWFILDKDWVKKNCSKY